MLFFKPTSTRKLQELCENPQPWLPCFFTSDQATRGNCFCLFSTRGPRTVQGGGVCLSTQPVDARHGARGCASRQVGSIVKRKTGACFSLRLIWQRVEMVFGKACMCASDPEAHAF